MSKYVSAYRITMLIAVLLLLVGILVIFNFLSDGNLPQAATTYEPEIVTTNTEPLCAGDLVIHDVTAHFNNTPVSLRVVSSLWSVDNHRNVSGDMMPSYVNYYKPETVKLHGEWPVPDDLSPGRYERRISTTAEGRRTEMFIVPFTVTERCD